MTNELKKRFITSVFLITLLALMYFYSFILIISLIIIALITWIEFYALISKIFLKEKFKVFIKIYFTNLFILSCVYCYYYFDKKP